MSPYYSRLILQKYSSSSACKVCIPTSFSRTADHFQGVFTVQFEPPCSGRARSAVYNTTWHNNSKLTWPVINSRWGSRQPDATTERRTYDTRTKNGQRLERTTTTLSSLFFIEQNVCIKISIPFLSSCYNYQMLSR